MTTKQLLQIKKDLLTDHWLATSEALKFRGPLAVDSLLAASRLTKGNEETTFESRAEQIIVSIGSRRSDGW